MYKRDSQKGIFVPIVVLLVLSLIAVSFYFVVQNNRTFHSESNTTNITPTQVSITVTPSLTPTPMPFNEMTIPYLREREYNSKLVELEEYSDNSNYTSYLTSYDSDGFRISGLLTIPKGDAPLDGWPAVVFVHGYIPPQEYRTTQNYSDYVAYLANRGLVVFKIDLRGHGDSEGTVHGAYYSSDYIIDTLNAHSALQNSDFVDPDRIGLWGHSMAGNVVFRSFVSHPKIKKVVIWAGAVYTYEDFQDFRIQDTSYQPPAEDSERRRRRERLNTIHGDFDPDDNFWKQVVPTNYLEDVEGSVEVHHAINDNVVDIRYSRNLMQVLEGTDVKHELYEYLSGGHNLTGISFNQAMQRTVDFYLE